MSILKYTFLPFYYLKSLKNPFHSKENIRKLQNKKLRHILLHAYKFVPFYRRLWRKNNIDVNYIKTVEDLRRLPIITREDVIKNFKDLIAVNYRRYVSVMVRQTSGTTSSPISVLFDIKASNFQQAIFARTIRLLGYNRNEPLVIYSHEELKSPLDTLGIIRRIVINSRLSEEKQLEILSKIKPRYLLYFPQSLFLIAKIAREYGITFDTKIIFTHGEILTKRMRKYILSVFNGDIFDLYASVENGYIAWECPTHKHYHLNEDSLIVETIDFFGKLKSVIITNLFNEIMPLIRYEQGDLIKGSDDYCELCNFSTIKSIEGRKCNFNPRKPWTEKFIIDKIFSVKGIYNFSLDINRKILNIAVRNGEKIDKNNISLASIFREIRFVKKIYKNSSGKYINFI